MKPSLGEGVSFETPEGSVGGFTRIMHYVYLIKSVSFPDQTYIGFTENLKSRMNVHNSGESKHTAKYRPWQLVSYHAFTDKKRAQEFEYYLKTGSGRAFANKRFW